jgi:hypothetical protein
MYTNITLHLHTLCPEPPIIVAHGAILIMTVIWHERWYLCYTKKAAKSNHGHIAHNNGWYIVFVFVFIFILNF